MPEHGLGRQPYHDPRSIQPKFLVRNSPALTATAATTPRSYTWGLNTTLDQLKTPRCVGYSAAHEIGARPRVYPISASLGDEIYELAQSIDREEGRHWDEGASILAGAKALRKLGFLSEFRWAKSAAEFAVGVSRIGPGLLGVDWTEDMMSPDSDGYIWPTGDNLGGHAVADRGYRKPGRLSVSGRHIIQNSWGPRWGGRGPIGRKAPPGCAFLTDEALQTLLDRPYADACIPVIRH